MDLLRSLALAFSSFSKIPMPQVEWREENMRYMMCLFPIIGVVIGLALGVWVWVSGVCGIGPTLFGAGVALIPVAISGGIHLDGFCDVVDAQSSHAQAERKREILKDPHSGAFAAIAVAAYLVAYAAIASEIAPSLQAALLLGALHVSSRCMSGIATVSFRTSKSKGMLSMFHESADGKRILVVLVVELLVATALCAFVCLPAIAVPCAGLVVLAWLNRFAQREFGGMSGDLAGFFLQCAELVMLLAVVIVLKVVGL